MNPRLLIQLSLFLSALIVAETRASERSSERPSTVLFLCPHGAAKSVIAASYFNQLARERALSLTGVAAATEEPYDRVPPPVAAALAHEGIDVAEFRPRRIENEDAARALRIVAINCDPSKMNAPALSVERWDDVPKVSEDLPGATRAIRLHVEKLIQEIAELASGLSDRPDPSTRTCIPP